jgi:hypothetical protein
VGFAITRVTGFRGCRAIHEEMLVIATIEAQAVEFPILHSVSLLIRSEGNALMI